MTERRRQPATSLTAFGATYFALVSGGILHESGGRRVDQIIVALILAIPMLFCAGRLLRAPLVKPRWTAAVFPLLLALFLLGGPIALFGFVWTQLIYGTAFAACVYFAWRHLSGWLAART